MEYDGRTEAQVLNYVTLLFLSWINNQWKWKISEWSFDVQCHSRLRSLVSKVEEYSIANALFPGLRLGMPLSLLAYSYGLLLLGMELVRYSLHVKTIAPWQDMRLLVESETNSATKNIFSFSKDTLARVLFFFLRGGGCCTQVMDIASVAKDVRVPQRGISWVKPENHQLTRRIWCGEDPGTSPRGWVAILFLDDIYCS